VVDVEWFERQRAFQARVLVDPDPELDQMWFRTTVGPSAPEPPRPLGRLGRGAMTALAGATVVGLLLLLDVPRVIAAGVAALWGGATLFVALAGPGPSRRHAGEESVALLALWPSSATAGDPPACVAPILPADRRRLGVDGAVTVVGRPRPDATFGAFADDHLVWPQGRPRRARPDDPGLGT